MLQKRDYVRYAGQGGLSLWDNECLVRWHNLSASDRADWLLFFDVCREEPTVYTEAIIAAIMNGLCPHRTTANVSLTKRGSWGVKGVDWERRKIWYFREDRKGFGTDSIPEFTQKQAGYFLTARPQGDGANLLPIAKAYGPWRRPFRQRAWKVHKFDHYFDAWRFLFRFI